MHTLVRPIGKDLILGWESPNEHLDALSSALQVTVERLREAIAKYNLKTIDDVVDYFEGGNR